jgi:hypothetical protein
MLMLAYKIKNPTLSRENAGAIEWGTPLSVLASMIGTTEGGWNTNADAQGEGACPIGFGRGRWGTSAARRRIGTRGGAIDTPDLPDSFSLGEVCAMSEVI